MRGSVIYSAERDSSNAAAPAIPHSDKLSSREPSTAILGESLQKICKSYTRNTGQQQANRAIYQEKGHIVWDTIPPPWPYTR